MEHRCLQTILLAGAVVRSRRSVIVPDVRLIQLFAESYLPATRSELSVPMVIGEEVVGVLSLQSDRANAGRRRANPYHIGHTASYRPTKCEAVRRAA